MCPMSLAILVGLIASLNLVHAQWNNLQQSQQTNRWGQQSSLWGQRLDINPLRRSWGNQNNIGWWNGGLGNNGFSDVERYQTCVGRNQLGEMRVSFTEEDDPARRFRFNWNQPVNLRFSAVVIAGVGSQLQGQFQFVVTEYGRVEDSCISRALGDILTSNDFWNQNRARGIVGRPIRIMQGQRATSSEVIENLSLQELTGRGFALCPTTQLSGSKCFDTIPLCCKLGRDSRDVTRGFNVGQFLPGTQGNFGGGLNGGMGSLGGGLNGNLGGMGGGLGTGSGVGVGGGLGGILGGGSTGGGQNTGLPGSGTGGNTGTGLAAGGGQLGGLTFPSG